MSTLSTLGHLIDLAARLEKTAYAFYSALEVRFSDKREFASCIADVKMDELLHTRVLSEIKQSLSEARLQTPVPRELTKRLEDLLNDSSMVDVSRLVTSDDIFAAVQALEAVEFDVVMEFVNINEIDYEFTRTYLRNETVDHTNKVFRALHHLD